MAATACPTGCGRTRAAGHLMCRPCWSEVPRHLQRDVHRAWRAWRVDLGDAAHMRAYRAASDAAIASVR
jgi:hypothetical protein